jgi:hypothetical protein
VGRAAGAVHATAAAPRSDMKREEGYFLWRNLILDGSRDRTVAAACGRGAVFTSRIRPAESEKLL